MVFLGTLDGYRDELLLSGLRHFSIYESQHGLVPLSRARTLRWSLQRHHFERIFLVSGAGRVRCDQVADPVGVLRAGDTLADDARVGFLLR